MAGRALRGGFEQALAEGRPDVAADLLRRAIRREPREYAHHTNLANILRAQGKLDDAETHYRRALALRSDCPQTLANLGLLLCDLRRDGEAESCCRRALDIAPGMIDARLTLATVLRRRGESAEALAWLSPALPLAPDRPELHVNLGNLLQDAGRLEEAAAHFTRALALAPAMPEIHNNLGNVLGDLGRMEDSAPCFERAIALSPDFAAAHSNLVVTLPFLSSASGEAVLEAASRAGAVLEAPHRAGWSERHYANPPDPERRLRIGYLSPSLRGHVLAPYIEPILRAHHRDRVEVFVYAHVPDPDEATERLMGLADHWRFVHALSDDETAAAIAADGIDILIEPMGHWAGNRLGVFARRPAPVQVSYLCQGLTTGLAAMDYVIGDRWLNRNGAMQRFATERVVELPSGFQVTSFAEAPPVSPPPLLANGFVTFGSFNNPSKISDATLDLWARVLDRVPGSRLLIKGKGLDQDSARHRLGQRLQGRGIGPDRVEMLGWVGADGHLPAHGRMDIMLDTAPFTGGRTTLEALWMGVPVVTLVGETVYGRFSHSHLCRIGAGDLAAFSAEEYVAIATALAGNPERIGRYRRDLRPALLRSSLIDSETHAREIEDAFRAMWRRWCGADQGEFPMMAPAAQVIERAVTGQYERFPYPPPVEEIEPEILSGEAGQEACPRRDFHIYWPAAEPRTDLDVLVAGCGSSQAIYLAIALPDARITAIDLSETSIANSRRLAARHGIANVDFRRMSLYDVAELGRDFDLIVSTGVIHHLPDPAGGLAALRRVLRPSGAMLIMLYARYGRDSVYLIQDTLRTMGFSVETVTQDQIDQIVAMVRGLPETHPIHLRKEIYNDFRPEEIIDLYLHPQDRAYTVPEIHDLLDHTGLVLQRWVTQAPYSPRFTPLVDLPLYQRIEALDERSQHAIGEQYRAGIHRHIFVACRDDRPAEDYRIDFESGAFWRYVPQWRWNLNRGPRPDGTEGCLIWLNSAPGIDLRIPLDATQTRIGALIDGRRTVGDMVEVLLAHADEAVARGYVKGLLKDLWLFDAVLFRIPTS